MQMTLDQQSPRVRLAWGKWFWLAVCATLAVLIVVWIRIPWQWSPVDDAGQVTTMNAMVRSEGYLSALLERVGQLAQGDLEGGVFRPLAWIYPPIIYALPVGLAHLLRLLMVFVILLGPLVYFRRKGSSPVLLASIAAVLLIAAGSTYQGLVLLSIQEVGGLFFISIGLMLPNRFLRLIAWVLAAFFKGPFVWILFGYSIALWKEGRRRLALASGTIGLLTFLVNVWWSRSGTYTGHYRINFFDPEMWNSASRLLEPFNGAILLAVIWWVIVSQTGLRRNSDFPIFAFASIGYYVQLVPWGFTAYYMGPISFLFGLLLASTLVDVGSQRLMKSLLLLSLPVLLAIWILKGNIGWSLRTNEIIHQATECLAGVPGSITEIAGGWLYITSSEEGPVRLMENIQLSHPEWRGEVRLPRAASVVATGTPPDYILLIDGAELNPATPIARVCERTLVTLVKSR